MKMTQTKLNTVWKPIKRGDGKITGWIEVVFHKPSGRYMTIPGVTGFRNA